MKMQHRLKIGAKVPVALLTFLLFASVTEGAKSSKDGRDAYISNKLLQDSYVQNLLIPSYETSQGGLADENEPVVSSKTSHFAQLSSSKDHNSRVITSTIDFLSIETMSNSNFLKEDNRAKRSINSDKHGQQLTDRQPRGRTFEEKEQLMKKEERRDDENPDIDDIINGIMKLLGGNVKIDAASTENTRLTTFTKNVNTQPTRTNDRGPPRVPLNPFNYFNGNRRTRTRPPIRQPISTPANLRPFSGRPSFVANTLPPFFATLPPLLDKPRPPVTPMSTEAPSFHLPENMFPQSSFSDESSFIASTPIRTPPIEESTLVSDLRNSEYYTPTIKDTLTTVSTIPVPSVLSSAYAEEFVPSTVEPFEEPTTVTSATPIVESSVSHHTINIDLSSKSVSTSVDKTSVSVQNPPSVSPKPSFEIPKTQTPSINILPEVSQIVTPTSIVETLSSSALHRPTPSLSSSLPLPNTHKVSTTRQFRPDRPSYSRPGVVLDAQYNPHGVQVITSPPTRHQVGEIFDVTVSALQGYGGVVNDVRPPLPPIPSYNTKANSYYTQNVPGNVLLTSGVGDENFVSIDGRKTYFNLHEPTKPYEPSKQTVGPGVGVVIPEENLGEVSNIFSHVVNGQNPKQGSRPHYSASTPKTSLSSFGTTSQGASLPSRPKHQITRRPNQPLRIDTCIVGDDSTCQEQLLEICRTVGDVSSCYCRPGTDRKRARTMCKEMSLLEISLKVDKIGNQRIHWNNLYANPDSEEFKILHWEAKNAIDDAFARSGLNNLYISNTVEKFYSIGGKVIVNSTIRLESSPSTRNRNIKRSLQRHLIKVIQDHNNNIGNSKLGVEGPLNPIPLVEDVNECTNSLLNNCHENSICLNHFATFTCKCHAGYTDRYASDPSKAGRNCESCFPDYCHKRGECSIDDGVKICKCKGSYYGDRCEVDGEVVAVAVGASVAAVVIIILTLLFLCMWSRRWKTEDQKSEAMRRGGFMARAAAGGHYLQQKFGFMANVAPAPAHFGPTMEDHIRWAHMNEAAAAAAMHSTMYNTGTTSSSFYGTIPGQQQYESLPRIPPHPNYPGGGVYNRVSRTLSDQVTKGGSRILDRVKGFFTKKDNQQTDMRASFIADNNRTRQLQQMFAMQRRVNESQYNASHPSASMYKQRMQQSSNEYGTMYGGGGPSHYGGHQLNPPHGPVPNMVPTMMSHLTRNQYQTGPPSLAMSAHALAISRASTLPLQNDTNASSGGDVTSSEEEDRRANNPQESYSGQFKPGGYQLPRPKSRVSIADTNDDIYYELDEMEQLKQLSNLQSRQSGQFNGQYRDNIVHQHNANRIPYPSKPPPPLPRHIFS